MIVNEYILLFGFLTFFFSLTTLFFGILKFHLDKHKQKRKKK